MSQALSHSEKEAFWRQQDSAWRESGLSQRAYCALHHLGLSTFQWWRRQLARSSGTSSVERVVAGRPRSAEPQSSDVEFVALGRALRAVRPNSALTVVVGSQYRVEVGGEFDRIALTALLDVLEERAR